MLRIALGPEEASVSSNVTLYGEPRKAFSGLGN